MITNSYCDYGYKPSNNNLNSNRCMQVKNLDAAKQLVNEYRSITLEQIEKVADNIDSDDEFGLSVLRNITGFGSINTCILCSAMGHPLPERCEGCIHSFFLRMDTRIVMDTCVFLIRHMMI